jgi:hypothetical protein
MTWAGSRSPRRDREVALVAAVVTRQGIDGHADKSAFSANRVEEHFVGGPHTGEVLVLDDHAFFRAEVAHQRHLERRLRQFVRLDSLASGIAFQERHARPQPSRGDAVRVQHHHAAGPVAAAAVTPQRPRRLRQFGVARLGAEISEALLEGRVGAVPRIAPHLTVGFIGLLVGGRQPTPFAAA